MNKITPLLKGIITGVLMVAVTLILVYTKQTTASGLQYIIYAVYAGGIAWTLLAYFRTPGYTGKFGDTFGQGFRCFIVASLIVVAFTGIFSAMHPEYAERDAKLYEEYLLKEQKSKLEPERKSMVESYKENYTTQNMWRATFGTLIPGAIFTAAGAGLLLLRKR